MRRSPSVPGYGITLFLFALGILMALSPSVAQLHGAGKTAAIAPLVRQSLWLAILLGILCFFALRHLDLFLVALGIEPVIVPITGDYLRSLSWGMFPIFIFMALRLFGEGIARTKPILLVSLLGLVVNVAAMTFIVPLGLSMAITVRVGHALGGGDPRAARFSGLTGIGLSGLFMTEMAVLIFLGHRSVARFYTVDPEVVAVAAGLLQLAALFQISDGLQVGALGALRGLKGTQIPMLIVLVAYLVDRFSARLAARRSLGIRAGGSLDRADRWPVLGRRAAELALLAAQRPSGTM